MTYFAHIRNGKDIVATIAINRIDDHIYVGLAIPSTRDMPNKRIGRLIANGRSKYLFSSDKFNRSDFGFVFKPHKANLVMSTFSFKELLCNVLKKTIRRPITIDEINEQVSKIANQVILRELCNVETV